MEGQPSDNTGMCNQLLVNLLRSVVHTPAGIKILSLTRWLYRYYPQDWFDVNHLRLDLPYLPTAFDGYRLTQISDLHLGTWLDREKLLAAIEQVNGTDPDLIAITGDFVTYYSDRFLIDLEDSLCRLRARDGILAILGNHDHWTEPTRIRACLNACGIHVLQNQVVALKRGEARLHIAGLDDVMVGKDDLDQVLSALPSEQVSILLAHEPDIADRTSSTGRFALQLSGHSHGGQINLPGLGSLYLPSYGKKYPAGLQQVNGMLLYTNSGLGTAEIQFRFNSRPEIAVFTLKTVKESTNLDSF